MNPYTTRTQARIQQADIADIVYTNSYLTGAAIAMLERKRGWQAEAEVHWLMKQHGLSPSMAASPWTAFRQAIGAALVRTGERLRGLPERGVTPGAADPLQTGV